MMLHMLNLAQRRCASLDELCHNEMSRDHDAPLEYLRILASLKLRFGLATLVTAHGALPVCSPMVALDTQLPNGYVGRRAFPMEAEGRLADFDRRIHPRQSEGCYVSLIGLAIHPQQGGELPQSECMTWRA